jgi:hypothetical protein
MTFPHSALVAALAALALAFCNYAVAQGKHDHGHGKEEKHFKVAPPADIKAAWTLITAKTAEAAKLLTEKKVEPIHEIAEHLDAAVHVLEEKSTMVTGEKKNRLTSALKQLEKAVDQLHHAAEENKAGEVGTELKKIGSLLPLVEAQYPAGALK